MKNSSKYLLIVSLIFVQSLNQTYASSKGDDKKVIKELETVKKVESLLREGKMPSDFKWEEEEVKIIKAYIKKEKE